MAHENIFGSAIAGALNSTAMFRTFVEKGLLTPEEAAGVMNQAANAVRDWSSPKSAPPFTFCRAFSGSFIPDTELNQLIDQVLLDTRPVAGKKVRTRLCRVIYLEREASRAALLLLANFGKEGRPKLI